MGGDVPQSLPAPEAIPQEATLRDVEIFRVVAARRPVESVVRGASMGAALPDGCRIRIAWPGADAQWVPGQVVAFLGGSRVMVHRIAHAARGAAARGYLVTYGDGNWFCDPPVESAALAGRVEEHEVAGEWRPVAPADLGFARRATLRASAWMLRALVERSPRAALRLARVLSYGRNTVSGAWNRLMPGDSGHVRN